MDDSRISRVRPGTCPELMGIILKGPPELKSLYIIVIEHSLCVKNCAMEYTRKTLRFQERSDPCKSKATG